MNTRTRRGPGFKNTSCAQTEAMKKKLRWLADNPGEWLWWGTSPHAVVDLREPAFERIVASPGVYGHRPEGVDRRGLWIRYRGIA